MIDDKIDAFLGEAKEFPPKVIKQLQAMTDRNDHANARVLAAKTIRDKKMEMAYQGIANIINYLGHMPHEISMVRNEIDKRLFHTLKTKYTNGQEAYMSM